MRVVVIVEDDPPILEMVEAFLIDEGYDAYCAADGKEGLDLVMLLQPDAVLMDLRLPVLDGVSAITRIKEDPSTKHIPVIAMSAERNLLSIPPAEAAIAKPFDIYELLVVLEQVIPGQQMPEPHV